jgi:hypothetical protein
LEVIGNGHVVPWSDGDGKAVTSVLIEYGGEITGPVEGTKLTCLIDLSRDGRRGSDEAVKSKLEPVNLGEEILGRRLIESPGFGH